MDDDEPEPPPQISAPGDDPPPPAAIVLKPEVAKEVNEADLTMIEDSQLGKALADYLKNVYEPLEIWYMRSSIEKVSFASLT